MTVFAFLTCLFRRHRWRVYDQADQALPPATSPPRIPWGTAVYVDGSAVTGPSIRVECQRCGARALAGYEREEVRKAWLRNKPTPTWRLVAPWGREMDGALTHAEVEDRRRCRLLVSADDDGDGFDEGCTNP